MPPRQRSANETRLITIRILILAFILCFNSITTAYIDTLLPDMMTLFNVTSNKSEAGKAASGIFTLFFVGRFISASFWGTFIDKHGRKTGVIIALVSLTICTFLFGLSSNLYYALFIRFITGLCNGLSIIGKTLSTEICPDDMKPWSISVTNTIWSLGMTIGPIIGASTYNRIPTFPILSSSLAVCLMGCLLLVLSIVYFEETLHTTQHETKEIQTYNKVANRQEDEIKETTSNLELSKIGDDEDDNNNTPIPKPKATPSAMEILSVPNVPRIIAIFSTNTFYTSVLVGLIPFWVASRYEDGGLDFQYRDIADVFVYLTLPQLILQTLLYPMIQKRRGDFWLITRGHYAYLPLFFFLPFAHTFGKNAFTIQKIWITFWLFIRNLASFMNFAVLQRYGNDIISPQKRGRMNGIQITFSSLFQILGTFLGGWLLSWSETNNLPYPFNYHLVFLLMCLVTVVIIVVVSGLKFTDKLKTKLIGEETISIQ
jgi:MFS family permease